jgi:hypothetical protein
LSEPPIAAGFDELIVGEEAELEVGALGDALIHWSAHVRHPAERV